MNRIVFQNVQLGDQTTGGNQTSGISITLDNVDLEAVAFDSTSVFSAFGGGIDIDLTDVQMEELAIFNSTITGGLNAGVTIDVASVSRNATIDELVIAGTTIDGVALTAVGLQKPVIDATQTTPADPVIITVPDHGLQTGAEVRITDVTGLAAANTRDTITVLDEKHVLAGTIPPAQRTPLTQVVAYSRPRLISTTSGSLKATSRDRPGLTVWTSPLPIREPLD